jgi:hypothetical protein
MNAAPRLNIGLEVYDGENHLAESAQTSASPAQPVISIDTVVSGRQMGLS